jgi:hypothetical protein
VRYDFVSIVSIRAFDFIPSRPDSVVYLMISERASRESNSES